MEGTRLRSRRGAAVRVDAGGTRSGHRGTRRCAPFSLVTKTTSLPSELGTVLFLRCIDGFEGDECDDECADRRAGDARTCKA